MRPSLSLVASMAFTASLLATASMAADRPVNLTKPFASDGSVSIENVAGSIRVNGWEKNEIKVVGTLGEGVEDLGFTVAGNKATIEVKLKRGLKHHNGDADLQISVPRGVALSVETVSADIDVAAVERSVDVESVSGTITLTGRARDVKVESVSGNVTVKGALARVNAESVSGTVRLEGISGEIDAETVSGSIEVSGSEISNASCESVSGNISFTGGLSREGRYSFDSFSGSVTLQLPDDTDADVSMSTFSGRVVNELTGTKVSGKEASLTLGDGGADLEINTFSGSALIKPMTK